eukprot:TRINITY_DN3787_c0_g1_i1.p1 TRINITY_DN3787_c0_g1~~TRINITY_DN3787_c0_g1_i1.p1  ORF type:complete len:183 (+),score=28.65 TRINITY_DN3787_c0_g1_i1:70-549(+)
MKKGEIALGSLTDKNLKQLKILNSLVFPVQYPDKFYTSLIANPELSQLAFFNDVFVGAVCCRLEKDSTTNELKIYIMTLGVLAQYRKLGLGRKLLEYVLNLAQKKGIKQIYLNVQTSNQDAIEFYKKFNFVVTGEQKGYYKNIDPPDAYFLTLNVTENK